MNNNFKYIDNKDNDRKRNILIVYRNYDVIKRFITELEIHDFYVIFYNNTKLALDNYVCGFYSLLLLELRSFHMTGFEFYSKVRRFEKVPVCFFTELPTYYKGLIDFHAKIDVNCFIKSSINLEDFMTQIQSIINNM
jgi:response regulator RpfG family c-di-GMP phosphodiesterase